MKFCSGTIGKTVAVAKHSRPTETKCWLGVCCTSNNSSLDDNSAQGHDCPPHHRALGLGEKGGLQSARARSLQRMADALQPWMQVEFQEVETENRALLKTLRAVVRSARGCKLCSVRSRSWLRAPR